jgi:hypothetical protein
VDLKRPPYTLAKYDKYVAEFHTTREAKEYLIGKIVEQAQRESVDLTETERKMLYFSETAWSLADIYEVNDAFEREYDQAEYEEKISLFIRHFLAWSRKHDSEAYKQWKAAVRTLETEDHYLLVMIGMASGSIFNLQSHSQRASPLKLLLTAVVGFCVLFPVFFLVMFLIARHRH